MSNTAIKFENISKQYRLGLVSTRTLSHDLNRWWQTMVLRKEDPYLKIGESNDRSKKGESEYVWALKNIDFEVEKGDVLGIIGKNGAGKSTLLKILSRVTSPTTGSIKAQGRIASLLEVGTGFHPELTGRENIYMNGSIMGMTHKEIDRKLDEIVDFAGVERYLDTPVKRYSSGMTVRLGFSIAAHLEPDILVVDEVLAVGDAEFQKKAIGKMQDVSRGEGRTVLFVSHNMQSIKKLCNKGIMFENGINVFDGEVSETINFYLEQNNIDEIQDSKIISLGQQTSPDIFVDGIKINGKDGLIHNIRNGENELIIEVSGTTEKKTRIELEGRLFDTQEFPLAMFSLGHNKKEYKIYEKGNFSLRETIVFPKNIHNGTYMLSLDITNPGVEFLYRISNKIQLIIEGSVTEKGNVFEYKNGNGFIHLLSK